MLENILPLYGLDSSETTFKLFGDGLINHTWKVNANKKNYILQKVNNQVFKTPEGIDKNLSLIKNFLDKNYPDYLFVSPVKALNGQSLLDTPSGYYRLFPFIEGSASVNSLTNEAEAYEAARQFGKFSKILDGFDAEQLSITIPDFHNLSLRYEQFVTACLNASGERLEKSGESIDFINAHKAIVDTYRKLVDNKEMPLRVIHHDTKINNVLFDEKKNGLCVIDLDTVMPGYFISDVGDMMRTYLAEASEEENDLSKIRIRKNFFDAIHEGYMQEMKGVLTDTEKQYFNYAGKFIIYMQAIRFLTDYLQNDVYYGQKYDGQNFNRAINQITLLKEYFKLEAEEL
ncbi:phosphotransferase enzyme family protein [Pedobacter psychroterrae]|uniref:Aminoglycoside phosphotransferase family protein n=1 Tax=Pedobacter psychroterrae TaxID=2530453 RepID=A0A4R0NB18_9SPHI|nr:aminoglycoside phosphotransferase family protein [Pedobacter psychroterrae]TCC97448.1 aminoglycoside phosphotransferase family protein [Pedobacter psychroterrae]